VNVYGKVLKIVHVLLGCQLEDSNKHA